MTSIKSNGLRRKLLLNGKLGPVAFLSACVCIWLLTGAGGFRKDAAEFKLAESLQPLLDDLTKYLTTRSARSQYAQCIGNKLRLEGSTDELDAEELKTKLESPDAGIDDAAATTAATKLGQKFSRATVLTAPCG